jgi:hypothetical protein
MGDLDPGGVTTMSRGLRSEATTPPEDGESVTFDPGGVAAICASAKASTYVVLGICNLLLALPGCRISNTGFPVVSLRSTTG